MKDLTNWLWLLMIGIPVLLMSMIDIKKLKSFDSETLIALGLLMIGISVFLRSIGK